jgi:glutathione S-transferase
LRLYDYEASPNCYKVRLLLGELGLEYERVAVDIFAGETMTGEYAAKNPALTTPVLELSPGEYLPESAAILLYLAEDSALLPAGRTARAQIYRWLFFEQSAIVPTLGRLRFQLMTGRLAPDSDEFQRQKRVAMGPTGVVEGHLGERSFLVGDDFTVADIGVYGYLHVAHEADLEMDQFPNVLAWLERVRSRPRHVADLAPYPENTRPGVSRSIWDAIDL